MRCFGGPLCYEGCVPVSSAAAADISWRSREDRGHPSRQNCRAALPTSISRGRHLLTTSHVIPTRGFANSAVFGLPFRTDFLDKIITGGYLCISGISVVFSLLQIIIFVRDGDQICLATRRTDVLVFDGRSLRHRNHSLWWLRFCVRDSRGVGW